jgi:hydrogenase-4 component F
MGIIAFGVGIGGFALYGAILHMIHHSLIKSSLFLSAGNIVLGFNTKLVDQIGGLIKFFPKTFLSFFAGFVGISGLPPFGIFLSELFILIGAFQTGHWLGAILFMFSILLVLAGAAQIVTEMSFGGEEQQTFGRERLLRVVPPYVLLLASIVLCVWMPGAMFNTIINTIKIVGGVIHG